MLLRLRWTFLVTRSVPVVPLPLQSTCAYQSGHQCLDLVSYVGIVVVQAVMKYPGLLCMVQGVPSAAGILHTQCAELFTLDGLCHAALRPDQIRTWRKRNCQQFRLMKAPTPYCSCAVIRTGDHA